LKQNKKICIAIRNTEPSELNPLKSETVKELWEKIYAENKNVMVIIVPNISAIKYGRNVGYSVEEIKVSDNIASISATSIRDAIKNGDDSWKNNVSPLIHKELEKHLK
jgi:predicted nucleotidyltransferase